MNRVKERLVAASGTNVWSWRIRRGTGAGTTRFGCGIPMEDASCLSKLSKPIKDRPGMPAAS